MWYFCQERSVGRIYSKLGGCVPHGGVVTTVRGKGGSSRLVEELGSFGRWLGDLDVEMVTS